MCFKYDIKAGIIQDWYKYLVVVCIALFSCVDYYLQTKRNMQITPIVPVFSDYILNFFRGAEVYVKEQGGFEIPVFWMAVQLYLAYIIGKYPCEDLYTSGKNLLLKSGSRMKWWLGKCVWCFESCLIYYFLAGLTIVAFCFVMKVDFKVILHTPMETQSLLYLTAEREVKVGEFIVILLLPIISSFTASIVQLAISILTKPIYGFLCVAVLCLASAYTCTPWLIGNASMIGRNTIFIDNGIITGKAYLICLAILMVAIVVGNFFMMKIDILRKETE